MSAHPTSPHGAEGAENAASAEGAIVPIPVSTAQQETVAAMMRQWALCADFIFVGGVARSGTTYLSRLLNAHPMISCGHELKMLPLVCSQRKQWWTNMASELRLGGMDEGRMDDCFRAFIATYMYASRQDNKPLIAAKTPENVTVFDTLARLFPRAKFVHIIRDGRAVVASLLKQNWINLNNPGAGKMWYCRDAAGAARYWDGVLRSGLRNHGAIAANHLHVLRYEDLMHHPEDTVQRLFAFLGVPYSSDILRLHPPTSASLHKWRDDLSAEQLSEVLQVAGPLLQELGYCNDMTHG